MSTFYISFESDSSIMNYEIDYDGDLINEFASDNMSAAPLAELCDHILEEDDIVKTISNIK